ncbi:hypothetical protein F5Y03DRAFT_7143 [Xylaria venustula]|nr:hypothetical protein F5Y03DRAFT_7143 [Xylaria venustula]
MLHLFRRRFGAGKETPGDDTEKTVDENPPPSYKDSQDASLREVLQGARAVLPLLWPSVYQPSPSISTVTMAQGSEIKQDSKNEIISVNAQEEEVIQALEYLAMAPCDGRPFLDRIRQFSDFYFAPYIVSEGTSDVPHHDTSSGAKQIEPVPIQERQLGFLRTIEAPRESTALVLCGRVLGDYYAGLGHADSALDISETRDTKSSTASSGNSSSREKQTKRVDEESSTRATPRTKTRITQIATCVAKECACGDFDEAVPPQESNPHQETSAPARCGCGHERTAHSSTATGISRLLRRYTNWDTESYRALCHRSPSGASKRRVIDIRMCAETNCPCPDYDKGRRTGRCARCGHYDDIHIAPVDAACEKEQEQDPRRKRKGGKKKSKGANGSSSGPNSVQRRAEWELSWILIENAYLLLDKIALSKQDEER